MANEESPKPGDPASGSAPSSAASLILPLVNLVALSATLGMLAYYKLVFKRPAITENQEKARLNTLYASPRPAPTVALVQFTPMTVNIASLPNHPKADDGTNVQIKGKLHYLTVGFSLQIKDDFRSDLIEDSRPFILDQIISIIGKKHLQELTTVQGRYVLQAQVIDIVNRKIVELTKDPTDEDFVQNLFFTQFVVQ